MVRSTRANVVAADRPFEGRLRSRESCTKHETLRLLRYDRARRAGPDSPLYDIPNVFLTPRIAGALGSETQRMTDLILAEIGRFFRGEPLQHNVLAADLERMA